MKMVKETNQAIVVRKIVCPNCETEYHVDVDTVFEDRKLYCFSCGEEFSIDEASVNEELIILVKDSDKDD